MDTEAIRDALRKHGQELLDQPRKPTAFTGQANADALLNDIERYPHAFVIACLMDRQWQAEKCWSAPHRFKERFGSFEFGNLTVLPKEKVISIFVQDPPLHRIKERMADIFTKIKCKPLNKFRESLESTDGTNLSDSSVPSESSVDSP